MVYKVDARPKASAVTALHGRRDGEDSVSFAPDDPERRTHERARLLWAAWLAALCVSLPWILAPRHPGLVWDEDDSFRGAHRILRWVQGDLIGEEPFVDGRMEDGPAAPAAVEVRRGRFDRDVLLAHFPYEHHPPLAMGLQGASLALFGKWLSPLQAARVASVALLGVLSAALTLFLGKRIGLAGGLAAGLAVAAFPRLVGDAQLAVLDFPMATFWTLCLLLAASLLEDAAGAEAAIVPLIVGRWPKTIALGALLGAALLVKVNALFLPFALLASVLLRLVWIEPGSRSRFLLWVGVRAPLVAATALAVAWAGWPRLWLDPAGTLREYVSFHSQHPPHPVHFLGENYAADHAPRSYPFLLAFVTTPPTILLACALGVLARSRDAARAERNHWLPAFFALHATFPLLLVVLPGSLRYDGVRLFLPALPSAAALAGMGVGGIARWVARTWSVEGRAPDRARAAATAAFLVVLVGPGILATERIHPVELSYFSPVVGGVDGAARRGLEVTYWGDPLSLAWTRLRRQLGPDDVVFVRNFNNRFLASVARGYDEPADSLLAASVGFLDERAPRVLPAGYAARLRANAGERVLLVNARRGYFTNEEWKRARGEGVNELHLGETPLALWSFLPQSRVPAGRPLARWPGLSLLGARELPGDGGPEVELTWRAEEALPADLRVSWGSGRRLPLSSAVRADRWRAGDVWVESYSRELVPTERPDLGSVEVFFRGSRAARIGAAPVP